MALGSISCGLGIVLPTVTMGPQPAYARDCLPGWLLAGVGVGVGVGPALTNLLTEATHDLAPHQSSTGSGRADEGPADRREFVTAAQERR